MAEITGLHVKISADSAELERGMKKATLSIENLNKKMTDAGLAAIKYGKYLAAAGVAGAAVLVKHSLDAIDATNKLARELGTTSESLGTLQRAASYAGVSTGDLENSLRILNRTIGDGLQGNQQIRDSFDRLGLSLTKIAGMNADEKMIAISDAMRGLGSNSERAAALADLFGRSGMKMSDLVMGGRDAMKQAADEAKSLGLAISNIDARQVENANDAWTRAKGAVEGLGNLVAVKLAPYLDALAQKFTASANSAEAVGKVMDYVLGGIAVGVATASTAIDGLKLAFTGLAAVISGVLYGLASVQDMATWALQRGANSGISGINKLKGVWNDFVSATQAVPGGGLSESLKVNLTDPLNFATSAASEVKKNLDGIMESFGEQMDGFEGITSRAGKLADEFMKIEEASRNAAVTAENAYGEAFGGGEATMGETDAEKAAAEKAAEEAQAYRDQLTEKLAALVEANLTEEQLLVEKRDNELAILQEGLDAKLVAEEDYRAMVEEIEFGHLDAMRAMREKHLTDLERFQSMSWQDQTKTVTGALADMTAASASTSKAMFAVNKAASLANAIVNTAEAITKNHAAYPEPIGSIMAGIAAAAGAAQIAAISSTSFGGGGSAPSSGGGSSASAAAAKAPQQAEQERGAFVQVNLQGGNLYSSDQVRGLIGAINDQIDAGVQIRGVNVA